MSRLLNPMSPMDNRTVDGMSPKQDTLAIQAETARIADIARDIRDCIEDESEEDRQESEWDARLKRNEEFLNRERHR